MQHKDEVCLEAMRSVVKEYIAERQKNQVDEREKEIYKQRFEAYRQTLRDESMRVYTAFDFMEKLYWQEYLITE